MGFWIFMLVMDLLFPVIMIVMGRYFMKTKNSGLVKSVVV